MCRAEIRNVAKNRPDADCSKFSKESGCFPDSEPSLIPMRESQYPSCLRSNGSQPEAKRRNQSEIVYNQGIVLSVHACPVDY